MRGALPSYRFGEFTLDPRLQRLTCDERIVPLKPKAYDLLCVLLANRQRVVSKNELLDWLWPRQDIAEANLSQTIYELRRALRDTAHASRWIENVPRRGYRFAGEAAQVDEPRNAGPPRSIAVLPFRSLGDESADGHLGLGTADSIILSLGATGRLVVRPLSAVLRFADSAVDALEIGRRLEVDATIEGTVQRVGDRLRVSARLLQMPGGESLWAGRHEGTLGELFEIQDRIAADVAGAAALRLNASERKRVTRSRPENPEAYALYLKARFCWHRWTPEAAWQAVQFLEQALVLDPGHAPSHAWLAAAWSTLGIFGALTPAEAAARARKAARRAIAIDETRSEGHEMQGAVELFFDWDLPAAARSLDRAIELDPDSSNARHLRALVLAIGGHNETALAEMLRALQADPSSLIAHTDLGLIHYWGRRYEEARRWFEAALQLDPSFAHARCSLAYTLLELGESDAAVSEVLRAFAGRGLSGDVAYVIGRAGRVAEAAQIVAELEKQVGAEAVDLFQILLGRLGLADAQSSFVWLERALAYRSRGLVLFGVSPVADRIRHDPRFRDLMCDAGLRELLPDGRSVEVS